VSLAVIDDDEEKYSKRMRKRMRDTYLVGKVFVPNTEYLSKHPLLFLTFIFFVLMSFH
jgi:hypothetical protein